MAKQPTVTVNKREIFGRKIKHLRRNGILPGNVFGKGIPSVAVSLPAAAFAKLYEEVGETGLIDLAIDGESKSRPVLVSSVHQDPVTSQYLHVDFHQVDLKVKVTAAVPVETIGESLAVKDLGGVLLVAVNEVDVEALPADLPEMIEVDISVLAQIGDSILAKDLKIDRSKIELQLDPEATIVTVQEQQEEEVEPEPEVEAAPEEAEAGDQAPAESQEGAKE